MVSGKYIKIYIYLNILKLRVMRVISKRFLRQFVSETGVFFKRKIFLVHVINMIFDESCLLHNAHN